MIFLNIEKKNFMNFLSIFHVFFAFCAVFSIKKNCLGNIEMCPFTYWLNGRWFLQIVDRDSGKLYPIYPLFTCSDILSKMWGCLGGGGVMFFLNFYILCCNMYNTCTLCIYMNLCYVQISVKTILISII